MDRSDGSVDFASEPQTVRTGPATVRTAAPAARDTGSEVPRSWPGPAAFDVSKMARPVLAAEAWASAFPAVHRVPAATEAKPNIAVVNPGLARLVVRYGGLAFCGWLALVLALIAVFRFANPPFSAHMAGQWLTGQSIEQTFVPIENVSPNLVRAVLLSEDGRFCDHSGIDLDAMQVAIDRAKDGIPRGASTISMQLTKNLFLWNSKSYLRKAIEIPLTFAIEALWSKRRIMEVYLNIAEWGPGIFGVEAAARYHFNKSAVRLSEREAAQLAVTLPNPIRRDAGDPGPRVQRLAGDIQARMRAASWSATQCVETRVRAASGR